MMKQVIVNPPVQVMTATSELHIAHCLFCPLQSPAPCIMPIILILYTDYAITSGVWRVKDIPYHTNVWKNRFG